jgi:hypothetical protein
MTSLPGGRTILRMWKLCCLIGHDGKVAEIHVERVDEKDLSRELSLQGGYI